MSVATGGPVFPAGDDDDERRNIAALKFHHLPLHDQYQLIIMGLLRILGRWDLQKNDSGEAWIDWLDIYEAADFHIHTNFDAESFGVWMMGELECREG